MLTPTFTRHLPLRNPLSPFALTLLPATPEAPEDSDSDGILELPECQVQMAFLANKARVGDRTRTVEDTPLCPKSPRKLSAS